MAESWNDPVPVAITTKHGMPSRLRFMALLALCFGLAVVQAQELVTIFFK
jgi:hypothetical protein